MSYSESCLPRDAVSFRRGLYDVLGVEPGVDKKVLKLAFWNRARIVHPDNRPPSEKEEAEKEFIALRAAYEELSTGDESGLVKESSTARESTNVPGADDRWSGWPDELQFDSSEKLSAYLEHLMLKSSYQYLLLKIEIIAMKNKVPADIWNNAESSEVTIDALATLIERVITPRDFSKWFSSPIDCLVVYKAAGLARELLSAATWKAAEQRVLAIPFFAELVASRLGEDFACGLFIRHMEYGKVFSQDTLRILEHHPVVAERLADRIVLCVTTGYDIDRLFTIRKNFPPDVWLAAVALLDQDPRKDQIERNRYARNRSKIDERLATLRVKESIDEGER
jgi:hypothetical protein